MTVASKIVVAKVHTGYTVKIMFDINQSLKNVCKYNLEKKKARGFHG